MRKIKSFKDLTLRRKGFILINDEFVLPVHTRGDVTLQEVMTEYEKSMVSQLPKLKPKMATAEQLEEMKKVGFNVGIGGIVYTKDFDKTDAKWLDFIKERNVIETFMSIAIHIDLNYDFDGEEMWEVLGLNSDKDFIGLVEVLREKEFSQEDLIFMAQCINMIKQSTFKTYEEYETAMEYTKQGLEELYSQKE